MRRAAQTPPPEPEPGAPGTPDVSAMSQAQYAQHRDQVMAEFTGGPRPSSEWMGGVDLPAGRAGLTLTDEQLAQLMPWRTQGARPVSGRALDTDYQQAQIAAQHSTGLATPQRFERS